MGFFRLNAFGLLGILAVFGGMYLFFASVLYDWPHFLEILMGSLLLIFVGGQLLRHHQST